MERKEYDEKKIELLIRVARMYYEDTMSQEEIAREISCSRPYISRLLSDAKEMGIVQFKIVPPNGYESEMEQELRESGGLDKAIVVTRKSGISRLAAVSRQAVSYLENVIKEGDIIGFSWGNTIYSVTSLLNQTKHLIDVVAVQLCGGISDLQNNIYSSEIAKNFKDAWGAKPYALVCPAMVDNKMVKDVLAGDTNISKVLEYGYEANVVLVTMGAFGLQNAIYRAGYLKEQDVFKLMEKGAVGDICAHVIDGNGNICDTELDERTVSVPLEVIKKKEHRIGVAVGQNKVECICAAIRGKIINVLITDEETAEQVLKRLRE